MDAKEHAVAILYERARENHLAGRSLEAEPLCRQVLRLVPQHADGLHLMGILLFQRGETESGVRLVAEAVRLTPEPARYLGTLGNMQSSQGQLEEAAATFGRAVALRPDFTDGFYRLGLIRQALGHLSEAEQAYRRVLEQAPDFFDAFNNLGTVLRDQRRFDAAETQYRQAVRLSPNSAELHNNLGNVLRDLGRPEEAEACYHDALRLAPDYALARYNLGSLLRAGGRAALAEMQFREALRCEAEQPDALRELGDMLEEKGAFAEAESLRRRLLQVRPDEGGSLRRLGSILCKLGHFTEAVPLLEAALRHDADDADTHGHLAVACNGLGRLDDAEGHCRAVLRQRPEDPSAHNNLGMILLAKGQLAEGWEEWEWRWKTFGMEARDLPGRLWKGEALDGATLFLHGEQGLGDTLQFCRYAPLAASLGKVVLEVQPPLVRLLSRLPGISKVIAAGDPLPEFAWHCPLTSLPRAFGTTLDTIPAPIPYLRADPAQVARWRGQMSAMPGLRIGLVWSGNPRQSSPLHTAIDSRRSLTLDRLAGLAGIPGTAFFSLQKGEAARQARTAPAGLVLHDFTDQINDFTDTAAAVEALDLVISVDTSVAHLAGALGKPVWLLNRFDSCWRWLRDRDDSPWYPSLRQFRQASPGDWEGVIAAVRQALTEVLVPARTEAQS